MRGRTRASSARHGLQPWCRAQLRMHRERARDSAPSAWRGAPDLRALLHAPSTHSFDLMAPLAIHIVYCGAWCVPCKRANPASAPTAKRALFRALTCSACAAPLARRGYGSKFRAIKSEVEKAFPGQTAITGEATPGATGFLEVQVVGGALLHSKKNGMGYVDTAAKMQAMCVSRWRALALVGCNAPQALQPPRWLGTARWALTRARLARAAWTA